MDTAVRMVSERGLRGVKITELATLAGLTTGAVYGNFRDKDDLLAAALLDDHTRKITADLAVLRMVVNEPSIRDLFSMVFTPEPNVRRILHITTFQTVHRNRNRTRELMVAHHQLVAEMERVIAHSAADGTVTLDDGVSPYLAAYLTQILPLGLLVVLGPTADWATDPVIAEVRNLYRRLFGYGPLPTPPVAMPAVAPSASPKHSEAWQSSSNTRHSAQVKSTQCCRTLRCSGCQ